MPITKGILVKHSNNAIFVETGTYRGCGISAALACGFKKIYSIEIDKNHFNRAAKKYKLRDNVELILGDSSECLGPLLENITEPVTFWLDAHTPDCPLIKELSIIKGHSVKTHSILIDDRRIFGRTCMADIKEDEVLKELKAINSNYKITYADNEYGKNDIIIACL